jgi:nitroimidazol reductase NimA-like FMN-containing flavoprotein (pyridoxamine 5'-phosphate oxidase superfamily)
MVTVQSHTWQARDVSITVTSGPWDRAAVEDWLDATVIPLRIATTSSHGPIVQSLWFQYDDGALWCATQSDSLVAQRTRREPVVGWEVSRDQPPYRGVRGRGTVEVVEDAVAATSTLQSLIKRYGQGGTDLESWLMRRADTEVALRISDLTVTSWDYSPRM